MGFEHMFLLMNSMNREVAQIFDTFVYTAGIQMVNELLDSCWAV